MYLLYKGLEFVSKKDRLGGVFVLKEKSEILHNRVSVVICFQEPFRVILCNIWSL